MRPEVARYRAYCDELKIRQVQIPAPFHHVLFVLAFPPSWSKKRKCEAEGMPHTSTPDRDNLEKALLDGVFGSDAHVWDGRTTKLWGARDLLIISPEPLAVVLPFDLQQFYQAAEATRSNGICGMFAPLVPI